MNKLLLEIFKGMKVYDQADQEVGTVDWVQFGDEDDTTPGTKTVTARSTGPDMNNMLVESIAKVFEPDKLPETLRDRLLRHGFIRVNGAGLFNADRYILPDQIASVSDKTVRLKISQSDLIKQST